MVTFNEDNIPLLSSLTQIEHITAPLIVAVGTRETPEFQRQAREFFQAVSTAGKDATLLIADE